MKVINLECRGRAKGFGLVWGWGGACVVMDGYLIATEIFVMEIEAFSIIRVVYKVRTFGSVIIESIFNRFNYFKIVSFFRYF